MALVAEKPTMEVPPEGNTLAYCYMIVDLGIQETNFQGNISQGHKIFMGWELPNKKMADGRPFVVGKEYSNSLGKRANLRNVIGVLRGTPVSDDEESIDLKVLLGKWCMVEIAHNKGYANAKSVTSVPDELLPALKNIEITNSKRFLDLDDFNENAYDELPQFIKDKIVNRLANNWNDYNQKNEGEEVNEDIPDDFDMPEGTDENEYLDQ